MKPSLTRIALAFAAIYLLWGSTYVFIRLAIETMPPLLMAGLRHLIAGSMLFALLRLRGVALPSWRAWQPALVIGGLLLAGGNLGVTVAEKTVPSGIAALVIASIPLWIVVLMAIFGPGGPLRPSWHERVPIRFLTASGLGLGFVGLFLLLHPTAGAGVPLGGTLILLIAALCWATGSLYARGSVGCGTPLMDTAMQMIAGGMLILAAGAVTGDLHATTAISLRSALAVLYLIVFGSLLGYTAYVWLLGVVSPAAVSTYAYVNPIVAVILGYAVYREPLNSRIALVVALILAAVALIGAGSRTRVARVARPESREDYAVAAPAARRAAS
jgi:drug/metabolite transporter (DMT)-like permease